jgi:PadR family transcriptional regulator, regulatory protein AphA
VGIVKTVAYVILAGLLLRPRSGYDLARWIERVTSHFFSVGHSSIYPALADLEQRGLVAHQIVPSDRGPNRKVYTLAETGHAALLDWVAQPTEPSQVRDELLVKALCYPYLPPADALTHVRAVRAQHAERIERYVAQEATLKAQHEAGEVPREAYLGLLLTLRRGIGAAESYLRWCDDAAALLGADVTAEPDADPDGPAATCAQPGDSLGND